jgi:hypothetical protein
VFIVVRKRRQDEFIRQCLVLSTNLYDLFIELVFVSAERTFVLPLIKSGMSTGSDSILTTLATCAPVTPTP